MDKKGAVILIEGSEQCGKTVLAEKIQKVFKAVYLHGSRPLSRNFGVYHKRMCEFATNMANEGHVVIIDRCYMSHQVYGTLFDGGTQYDTHNLHKDVVDFCNKYGIPFVIIHCNPDRVFDEDLREEMYDDSNGKISSAMKKEFERLPKDGLTFIEYDWQKEETGQSVLKQIDGLLEA